MKQLIPLHVLALLKIVAYSESPQQRQKDLADFAGIPKRFDPDDTRRFASDILDAGLDYDVVGAYLIGRDLTPICSPEEKLMVNELIRQLRDRDSPTFRLFRHSVESEFDENRTSVAAALIEAFALGFGSRHKRNDIQ